MLNSADNRTTRIVVEPESACTAGRTDRHAHTVKQSFRSVAFVVCILRLQTKRTASLQPFAVFMHALVRVNFGTAVAPCAWRPFPKGRGASRGASFLETLSSRNLSTTTPNQHLNYLFGPPIQGGLRAALYAHVIVFVHAPDAFSR